MVPTKRYKIRASAIVGAALLFLSLAAVSVSAYEPCRQVITEAVTKTEWPHYTAATVARWQKWGKDHPNYHAPKRQPKVTTQEVQHMVNFACALPDLEPNPDEGFLEENPYEPLAYDMDAPRPYMVEDLPLPVNTVALLNVPIVNAPVLPSEAPEPQAWILVATGMVFVGFCFWRRESATSSTVAC
jgi:hypothetical protein